MATRAIIKLPDFNVVFYKHWDGSPQSTAAWLIKFNQECGRDNDPNYKFAQLVRSSAFDCEEFNLDPSRNSGWGVYRAGIDLGQEYEYTLHHRGRVSVYDVYNDVEVVLQRALTTRELLKKQV